MQIDLFIEQEDYSSDKIMIGLSGGINSAAVLCWLAEYPEQYKPKELHLFYAHFQEHSPDTFAFVKDCIKFARNNFTSVHVKITRNSVIRFFEEQKMIPHPMVAPCTRMLKMIPMHEYMAQHNIKIDLVGYVREESKRVFNLASKNKKDVKDNAVQLNDVLKAFPISGKTNEWCFQIVALKIGWYPAIYNIKHKGKRLFTHNNCLPCKNMQTAEFKKVQKYFPSYYQLAINLSAKLKSFWGRDKKEFHLTFGRTPQETGYQKQSCGVCAFD